MSSLSIFPTEILECITGKVKTADQVHLWQCGDRILNLKLKNGGLKRTSLCWSSSTWMPWPRSYFETHGGIVDVEWVADFGTPLCPTLELNLLPKTLKHLDLACDDVFLLLRKQNVNLNDMLPILHTLRLSGSRLCEENFENLPSNLIELHLHHNEISYYSSMSSRIFSQLPRTIQRLTLGCSIADHDEFENQLPSDLIYLDILVLQSKFNWFSKLPKSLKSLKLQNPHFGPDWQSLPHQLEEMELHLIQRHHLFRLTKSDLPQLPQSLKSLVLQMGIADLDSTGKDELIPLLPKNLTRFQLYCGNFCHSGLQQLPVSLTDIDASISATHPDILSIFRPETIRMRLGSGPFSKQLNILPFPINLRYLHIQYLNDDMCHMLPPGLQTLKFDDGIITTKGASKLPKSLTSINTNFEVFENNQAMSHLGFISHLTLSSNRRATDALHNLTDDWLHSLLASPGRDSSQNAIPNDANHHLKSLTICAPVQRSFFDALSKFETLNKLFINHAKIGSDCFALIPPTVTSLTISQLSACPTANQLSSLPRGLKHLSLHLDRGFTWDWKDEDLQCLPRSLQKIVTHGRTFPNLTDRMHDYLPPYLLSATLNYPITGSREGTFRSPLYRIYGSQNLRIPTKPEKKL